LWFRDAPREQSKMHPTPKGAGPPVPLGVGCILLCSLAAETNLSDRECRMHPTPKGTAPWSDH